jgi:alpha-glucosidase/alpha-D-xyloside xylohydrolase
MRPLSRREAVRRLATAGAGLALRDSILHAQSDAIQVAGRPVEIAVSSVSPATVRITALPVNQGSIPDDDTLVSAAVGRILARRRARSVTAPIRAGNLIVRITADPIAIRIDTPGGASIQRLTLDAESPVIAFLLGKGPLLGLGEGGPQFDRKGIVDRGRNGQGGYQLRTHGGRVPIQWLVGTEGWGMFIHQPLGAFDLTGAEGRLTPAADAAPLDVFVTASSDPKVILAEYARITGHAQLPARWTFGYMQSHRTLAGPDEVMWVANTFREKRLPCDALIYLGTEFTPSGWNTRNGEFTWKKENFPNPKQMIDDLHAEHFHVVLHSVIEGRRMSGTVRDACTPDEHVPSGRTPDDKWPDDRAVPCYWPYHKPVYDLGIDGWWPDQGDGLDQPSRLARIRMYWEGPQLWRPDERPFALHRNGAPGMQRYGAFLWSGDVYSTWETLKTHVPVAVNTSLSGIPFWGTDIGGFVPTPEYTGELHVRWFQFGAFCPLFRAHGRTWHLRLPWGWNTGEVGPSETRGYTGGAGEPDASELHNAAVEPIVKQYLELRYRLLPYTYSVARECCQTGLPMMRSLWLHHPDDPQAVARGDQYLWGRDLLVSPVVEKGATSRRLYLPRGDWFDFWTEDRVAGGREIDRTVDLATMPLHVRAGAILPFGPIVQYADEAVTEPLSLVIYPGADGALTLYEDDGRTFDYRRGAWMGIETGWNDAARRLTLRLTPGSRMLPPLSRSIDVRVAGTKSSQRLTFTGRSVSIIAKR